jgi:hypothetical protein
MGSASSVASPTSATTKSIPQCSAGELVLSSQTRASSGSADPILVVYIYADAHDSVARAAAMEFAEQQMPRLCDMAASRGVQMFAMPLHSPEQLVDTNDAFGIFSERCSSALVAFVGDIDDSRIELPARLPLAFVQRCIGALKKQQPDAAAFLSEIFDVSPPSSSIMSCFSSDGWFNHFRL